MPDPIRYFDRTTRTVKTERVYGEKWLRFAYENPLGRFFLWAVARRAIFSKWYGWKMRKRVSANRILPFIIEYGVNVDEFKKSPYDFKTFNDFFYRALKESARPITPGADVAVLPADGRHLAFQNVDSAEGYYIKGSKFTVEALLGDAELGRKFAGCSMLISRLAPVDYHRFHFPVDGTPGEPRLINGWLYSVSPLALRVNLQRFVENKRVVTLIESPVFGTVAMVEVGATNVGTIQQSFIPGRAIARGDEKGLFAFGGSCVVTLFQAGRIKLDADLVEQSALFLETYAKVGERLGVAT